MYRNLSRARVALSHFQVIFQVSQIVAGNNIGCMVDARSSARTCTSNKQTFNITALTLCINHPFPGFVQPDVGQCRWHAVLLGAPEPYVPIVLALSAGSRRRLCSRSLAGRFSQQLRSWQPGRGNVFGADQRRSGLAWVSMVYLTHLAVCSGCVGRDLQRNTIRR